MLTLLSKAPKALLDLTVNSPCIYPCHAKAGVPYSACMPIPYLEIPRNGATSSNVNKALVELVFILSFSHNMWERKE